MSVSASLPVLYFFGMQHRVVGLWIDLEHASLAEMILQRNCQRLSVKSSVLALRHSECDSENFGIKMTTTSFLLKLCPKSYCLKFL